MISRYMENSAELIGNLFKPISQNWKDELF